MDFDVSREMYTLNFSEPDLPKTFRNAIISHDSESVEIRSSVKSLSDIKIWVEEFRKRNLAENVSKNRDNAKSH